LNSQCRLRKDNGAENFARLRHISLNQLKRWEIKEEIKASLRTKQKSCGLSRKFFFEGRLA